MSAYSDDGNIKISAINTADGGGSTILATGLTSGLKIGTTNSQPLHFYINNLSQGYFSAGGAFIVGTSPKTGYRNITVQNTQESAGAGSSFNLSANASSLTLAISSSVDGNYATITNNNGPVIVGTGSANPVALTVNSVPRLLVDSTGDCGVVSPTNKLGYVGGAGGSVIQSTSKSTNVTLNKPCGQITLNSASLAANTVVAFGLMNSTLKATDVLNITQQSPGTLNYNIWVYTQVDGAAYIAVKNITGLALAEAIVLNFAVLKGVVA
jgi:hypothetical protein